MIITSKEVIEAMEFIKAENNGETPYSYDKLGCAILMHKYAESKGVLADVNEQRKLLIAYEIDASKPYPYDIKLIEVKVDKYLSN